MPKSIRTTARHLWNYLLWPILYPSALAAIAVYVLILLTTPTPVLSILTGLVIWVVFLLSALLLSARRAAHRQEPAADSEPVDDGQAAPVVISGKAYFSHEVVRIADVLSDRGTIEGKTFDDCEIHGPAVLFSRSQGALTFDSPTIHGGASPDDPYWIRQPGDNLVGAVPVNSVVFRRCTFKRVGFVMTPSDLDKLKGSGMRRAVVEVPIDDERARVVESLLKLRASGIALRKKGATLPEKETMRWVGVVRAWEAEVEAVVRKVSLPQAAYFADEVYDVSFSASFRKLFPDFQFHDSLQERGMHVIHERLRRLDEIIVRLRE